ncbi:hypothetical protein JNM05_08950 [bacterium]|nr:hypothetical protein [bacterium]
MDEEVLLFPALMLLAGWALWLWWKRYQAEQSERLKRLEIQHELVKKFSTSSAFIDFVQSEQGKKVFIQVDSKPQMKIIRFLTVAVMLILIGIVMLINAYSYRFETDTNYISKAQDLYYWGSLAIAIGLGFLINAAITLRLAKKWNLFKDRE